MAELTYSDIREAIVEALVEHDRNAARYGSADQKLRKETKELTKNLLESVKLGFKERKSQDQEFLNKLEKKIFQEKQKSFFNEDGNFGFGTKAEQAFGNFLNKSFGKIDKLTDNLSKNVTLMIAQRWNAMSNEATQQVVNSIKSLNTSGIAQDWDKFTYSLRNSTIRLEDFIKATQQHNTALQILNKSTGNAAGTYQNLAKSAADFATHQGKVAYDNGQLSDAIGAYLEMQKNTANLDKLNEKELQNGINRLIVSADKLSKEYGLNRDELLKNAQKKDDNIDLALQAAGTSEEDIAYIKNKIAAVEAVNPEYASMIKKQIATFGYDAEALGYSVGLQSENVGLGNRAAQFGNFKEAVDYYISQETNEQIARNAPKGSHAGIINMKGGDWGSNVSKIQLNAKRALQTQGANTQTDQTIIDEQKYRNELIKKENNEIALLAKSAAGARTQFRMLTASVALLNGLLSAGVFAKNLINMFTPFFSQMMGVAGGLLSIVSHIASLANQIDSFRTMSDAGSMMDWIDGGRSPKATRALTSKNQVAKLRRIAGKKGLSRFAAKSAYGIGKAGTRALAGLRTVGGAALSGVASMGLGIGGELVHEYGSEALQSIGVGEKTANITSNYAGSALKGAGYGAMIGSIIPGVGTVVGGVVGGAVGLLAQGITDLFKSSDDKQEKAKEQEQRNYEESPAYRQQKISEAQQNEMIYQLRRIASGMDSVDYNTNNMVRYNY